MKIGLQIPSFTWPGGAAAIGPSLVRIAQTAEHAGFASLWVMDHFFQIEMIGKPDEPMLEAYTTLGFMAAATEKVKLGALVTGVIYRHPGILVKTVSALDVLSRGRAYFGIGAGWYERESVGLGVPFPPLKVRFEQLEETLQIALQMWSAETGPYHGKHFHLAETLNSPQPVSRPHPPIMIGGGGERKTLRLVAQYADACNLYAFGDMGAVRAKLDVLRRHCDALARPYDQIERTAIGRIDLSGSGGLRGAFDYCRAVRDAGIQHLIVSMPGVETIAPIELMGAEIIPAFANDPQ